MSDIYLSPSELVLGHRLNARVSEADQKRQRAEVEAILSRFHSQPGVILADEVGMGKTFVALAVAYVVAVRSSHGPAIVMAPANLIDKWEQDLHTFCELYLNDRQPVRREDAKPSALRDPKAFRYGVARHSVELMKLLDDPKRERCHLVFLAQGAMSRRQTDKWIRLALVAEALRRHGRGKASRLIQVKNQIHRFLAELLWAIGEERSHDWGEALWQKLLKTPPETWKETYNQAAKNERRRLTDDPVPAAVVGALPHIDLKPLAAALEGMPVRARGGDARVSERIDAARKALRAVEQDLWKNLLVKASWRSPLLVMDEAHHLKNPAAALARQLQSEDSGRDLRTGDGALARAFDRMLFLTATPFQLGHHELVRVLQRFGDVRWSPQLGDQHSFLQRLSMLGDRLDASQRAAIRLQQSWARLRPEDCESDAESWWLGLRGLPREELNHRQQAVLEAFELAKAARDAAQEALGPWIVRHNKGAFWGNSGVLRRKRIDGAEILGKASVGGLAVPPQQLLPFFLAARCAVVPKQDVLGEALCSSFEAFRFTRKNRELAKDEQEEAQAVAAAVALTSSGWYLQQFDQAIESCSGTAHPKVRATVRAVGDLWEKGEKVLVFAFYRETCNALSKHISEEIDRRINVIAQQRLREAGQDAMLDQIAPLLERIRSRYFDDRDSRERRALDAELARVVESCVASLSAEATLAEHRNALLDVMRRFLRVSTTLVRCFPIAEVESVEPEEAVRRMIDHTDGSAVSWRQKFDSFIEFLAKGCSLEERRLYLEASGAIQTGSIQADEDDEASAEPTRRRGRRANVRVATGETDRNTRARLMRAFNTPFFPDILVCSQVMGEGVDLQRFCRHVIHHDLAWNPSTIEQRTGRVDRLGCKAEGRHPIVIVLPYLAGTADERQYRVMSDRERWFRVVMGQDEVARLITPDSEGTVPLPEAVSAELSFDLVV